VSTTINPYQSPNDPSPFNPNAPASGSGGSTIPSNSPVPDLAMVVGSPPDFAPDPTAGGGGSQGGSSSSGSPLPDFAIDLAGLRSAESSMISASSAIVSSYTDLKTLFESVKDTVFGQQSTTTSTMHDGGSGARSQPGDPGQSGPIVSQTNQDPISASAISFANGSNGQPGMNDIQAYALQQIGNAMGLLGQFMAMLNASGWSYAQADVSSKLPPATPVGGLNGSMATGPSGSGA